MRMGIIMNIPTSEFRRKVLIDEDKYKRNIVREHLYGLTLVTYVWRKNKILSNMKKKINISNISL